MCENLQALVKDRGAALGAGRGVNRREVEIDARACPQDHASLAEDVERDQRARQHVRAVAWQRRHIGAELDALRRGGHGSQRHPGIARAVGKKHVIPERDRFPAGCLCRLRQFHHQARVAVRAKGRHLDTKLHDRSPWLRDCLIKKRQH
jgi:hypothetical protein